MKNLESRRKADKKWRLKNPDYCKKRVKEWKMKNPEKTKEIKKSWAVRNKDRMKTAMRRCLLRSIYGISTEEYQKILISQKRVCAICGNKELTKEGVENNLCVDHNHLTGRVRGLLCRKCNSGIGMFRDNSELLFNAIRYLKETDK